MTLSLMHAKASQENVGMGKSYGKILQIIFVSGFKMNFDTSMIRHSTKLENKIS